MRHPLPRPLHILLAFLVTLVGTRSLGQVSFWSDTFNGGLVTGGYGVGTAGSGTGSFTLPFPAGCTIHQAYVFGMQAGAAADITIDLNGNAYTFNASNWAGATFNSLYGGTSGVHAIDITTDVDPTVTNYTMTVPIQPSSVSNVWTEFYMMAAYTLPGATSITVDIFLGDQDPQPSNTYTFVTSGPMLTANDVGFATVGGYASVGSDCETIIVEGNTLGSFYGGDFNSPDQTWGSMGAMAYEGGVLTGLGDDNADVAIDGTDVVTNLNGIVTDGSTTFSATYDHCGGNTDNHIWMFVLAYSSDNCAVTANLGPDHVMCAGESYLLDVTQPDVTYVWQDGSTGPTFTATGAGNYWVTITGIDCDASDTINIDAPAAPVFDLGPDLNLCTGQSYLLDATSAPSGDVIWQDGSINVVFTATTSGIYWAEVDNQGCATRDSVELTFSPTPNIGLVDSVHICSGSATTLNAGNPGADFLWSTGALTQTITTTTTGMYRVTVTNGPGCVGDDSTYVLVHALPIVNIGPDTSLCEGQVWQLNAGVAGAYDWSTGANGQTLNISTPNTYWVDVETQYGCPGSDTIVITYDPLPVIELADVEICISETVVLDAGNPGSGYAWSNGADTQTISISGTGGTFSVVVTNAGWCSSTASATVDFVEFPAVDLGPDMELCEPDTLFLDAANSGSSFIWSTGSHGQTAWANTSGTIWVDVDNGFCVTRDSLLLDVHPLPAELSTDEAITCLNYPPHQVMLDAENPDCRFLWNTGDSTRTILANTYGWNTVAITTVHGCSIADSILVIEYCPPELFLPNCFTPNGDGLNDAFFPQGNQLAHVEMEVYNRWGQLIWSGLDGSAMWDGQVGGSVVPDGVYIWHVRYRYFVDPFGRMGEFKELFGHVTVLH